MAAALRMLPIVALLAIACGRAELTRAEATRIIRETLFPGGDIVETLRFREGPQCLRRHQDARAQQLRTLASLGYLTIRAEGPTGAAASAPTAQQVCDPTTEPVVIELTSEGTARAARETWTVTTGTHLLTLARISLGDVGVQQRTHDEAMVSFRFQIVLTPIGKALGEFENRKPMSAQFKRFADGWKIATLVSEHQDGRYRRAGLVAQSAGCCLTR